MIAAVRGRRVTVPLFELASCPKIDLPQVKSRMSNPECPVCGRLMVRSLLEHCQDVGDDEHQVLEVMGS